jgi:hypothetical protein
MCARVIVMIIWRTSLAANGITLQFLLEPRARGVQICASSRVWRQVTAEPDGVLNQKFNYTSRNCVLEAGSSDSEMRPRTQLESGNFDKIECVVFPWRVN